MNFEELVEKVGKWADDRQITENSYPLAQARKTAEEVIELVEAATCMKFNESWSETSGLQLISNMAAASCEKEYKDAVGDIIVTLIVACRTKGIDVVECLNLAYDEIKDRKGHLRPDGVFVKEE
jgi:NTP pyrophosphatase (non-canonical NTP hydrolase)